MSAIFEAVNGVTDVGLASVGWCAGDVQSIRPDWSDKKAESFLKEHSSEIRDAMVQAGWICLEGLIELG